MVCMYFTTVCITVCIPVCTVCMRNCSEMLISCHAAVFSEFPALTASFLPESFSDLTMPVLHRPAAAPRGVRRRPAAASELPQGVAAASNPAAQPPEGDAAESAIADEAWSEARDDGSRAEADDLGTGTSTFEGYRCVRKKKPPGRIHGRPPSPPTIQC